MSSNPSENQPTRWPRPRFSIRTLMILIAIVAIAPVATVKVHDCLDRRARYLDQAETSSRLAATHKRKQIQMQRMADTWAEQSKKGLPFSPQDPIQTEAERQERIDQYRKTADLERLGMDLQLEQEQKYRRAANRPWRRLEGDWR